MTDVAKRKPVGGVDAFLATLQHPLLPEVIALRKIVLGADPRIGEEIKWNVPSFRTKEHFATMHLRAKGQLQLILHFGAKKREVLVVGVPDPDALLDWLGPDRASMKFTGIKDLRAKRQALEQVIRHWIERV